MFDMDIFSFDFRVNIHRSMISGESSYPGSPGLTVNYESKRNKYGEAPKQI